MSNNQIETTIYENYRKALNMGISEFDDDAISRKTAICEIMGQPPELHYPDWYAEQIRKLPSAQPDVPDTNVGDMISRQAAIDTEGLDEQIRCEMCRNPMHTYRGCDGNCKYDEKLYERIMQILYERIKPLSSVQPVAKDINVLSNDTISRQAILNGKMVAVISEQAIDVVPVSYIKNLPSVQPEPSQVARDIATIIENEQDMRVMLSQPEIIHCQDCARNADNGGFQMAEQDAQYKNIMRC